MITMYSTGCPQCKALAMKLDKAGIQYELCNDENKMEAIGLKFAPALEVDGELMNFSQAVKWVNNYAG